MNVENFRQMYVAELQELRNVEAQLVKGLQLMAERADHAELKKGFQEHQQETQSQLERLDGMLQAHNAQPGEHVDQSMQGLIRESEKWAGMVPDPDLRDAGLIASAQRIEHYEIAAYGSLATWAKQLGFSNDQATLHAILDEEKRTDEKLTDLAKRIVNPDAAHA
ncbi:YciE/YciF ferroxidase family protein [Geminicoccus flavidas]|uniref:YciE/YciF ferroxidase family protein n=1 Tax=Geminicoccus flavidas TaxID=2506407 RepID=UPI001357FE87|nr:DUF892 family protein [Geminicoccus flavidas]